MPKICMIGDRDSVLGFMALGFSVHEAPDAESAAAALHKLARDPENAVVYITEQYAAQIEEDIARYNNFAGVNCFVGMALEKQKAMEHPYPATMDKIERFGYDPKQLHHALRMQEFMTRYLNGEPYEDCLISKQHDSLMAVKHGCYRLEQAREIMSNTIDMMKSTKEAYMSTNPVAINKHAEEVLQNATVEILKRCFLSEIGGAA